MRQISTQPDNMTKTKNYSDTVVNSRSDMYKMVVMR